jgi:diguanylate cyclase (GGDEF)-like protein
MILRILICLLALCAGVSPGYAASALPDPLKIVISNDAFPYMFANEQGEADGLVADYWREVARRQQIQVQFVTADWVQTLLLLQSGKVHVHGGMANTAAREHQYQLGDTGIDIYNNVFMQRDTPAVSNLQQLKPYAIGVIERSSHVDAIRQLVPDAILKTYPTAVALYDAAIDGNINVITGLDRLSPRYDRYNELVRQFPLYRKIPLPNIDLSYAVSKNSVYFAALQQVTTAIEPAFLDSLERRWLGVTADDDTLLLGLAVDNPPYMHVSLQGEAQGLFVDMWRKWSEQTGIKIAFVPDTSINNLQNLAKGRIDALIGFPDSDQLPDNVIPAYHLYGYHSKLFAPLQSSAMPLTAESTVKIGVFENAPYVAELALRYPEVEFIRYRRLPDMVNAVIAGELAGFYGATAVVPLRLQQLNRADLFNAQDDSEIIAPIYSLVRADKGVLAEQIRQGFTQLSLDVLIETEKKWISQSGLQYFAQMRQQTPLIKAERDWLMAHPSIRVGMLNDWAPMEYLDEEGNPAGVTVDMFDLLARRIKIQFEFKAFNTFEALLAALERKEIDIIANISEREERKLFARFTDEFWSTQWAVVGPNTGASIVSASELANKKVAIYQDYQLAQQLNSVYPTIEVIKVKSLRSGLDLLQQNKVDFVLDSVEAASEMLRQSGYMYSKVQVLDDLPTYPSLIAVRDDYEPLVTMLNKGLRSIGKDERQQLYKKWFSFQIIQGINRTQLRQLMWQVGGAAALLLAFVVIWNISLRREVALRREAEQKMRFMATHDDLTQLPNRSLIKERIEQALLQHARHNEILALLFIDLDGFKDVNDRYGHDAGDELLLKLAAVLTGAVRKSDTVARFGGDEFVILLTGLLSRDDAAIVAEKILYQLASPVALSVGDVQVGASIGIAVYPDDGTDSARLLKVADSLMYRIKQQGKNQYCFSKAVFS